MKKEDKNVLILCAVRYCFGRQTYMPGLVQEIVEKNIKDVNDKTIRTLERDIRERIEYHENGLMSIGDT